MFKESFNPYQEFNIKKDNYKRKQEIDEEIKRERQQGSNPITPQNQQAKEELIKNTLKQISDYQVRKVETPRQPIINQTKPEASDTKTSSRPKSQTEQRPTSKKPHFKEYSSDQSYNAKEEINETKVKYQKLSEPAKQKIDQTIRNLRIKYHPDKIIGNDRVSLVKKQQYEKLTQDLTDLHQRDIKEFLKQAKILGENIDFKI